MDNLMECRTRDILQYIPEDIPFLAAEIGVLDAANAVALLEARPRLTLVCVDSWIPFSEDWRYQNPNIKKGNWEPIVSTARNNLAPFWKRSIIVGMESKKASCFWADGIFDLIFIDACHEEPFVTDDIASWFPKLKATGILSGHDYQAGQFDGVCRAVNTFVRKTGRILRCGPYDSTWFTLPK